MAKGFSGAELVADIAELSTRPKTVMVGKCGCRTLTEAAAFLDRTDDATILEIRGFGPTSLDEWRAFRPKIKNPPASAEAVKLARKLAAQKPKPEQLELPAPFPAKPQKPEPVAAAPRKRGRPKAEAAIPAPLGAPRAPTPAARPAPARNGASNGSGDMLERVLRKLGAIERRLAKLAPEARA